MRASVGGRDELVLRVQQALALPTKKQAEQIVDTVIESLEATLLNNLGTNGFTLKLGSFGKFSVRHKPGILRKIPFTGATILTKDRRKVRFVSLGSLRQCERVMNQEQRERLKSSNLAERFAAALVVPGVLRERLRELSDFHLGQVLEHEVCSNLSVLAPELTVCREAAERLCRRRTGKFVAVGRSRASQYTEGEHLLHAESALYHGGIPHLLLPFQRNKFASNIFMVPCVREAEESLCRAGFRDSPVSHCAR